MYNKASNSLIFSLIILIYLFLSVFIKDINLFLATPLSRIRGLLTNYTLEIISAFIFTILAFYLKKKKDIIYISKHDEITDLISFEYFVESSLELLKNAKPLEYEIITIDIDYFRIINNIFGYETGTKVIKTFAKVLSENLKNSYALISRVTGDQFVILKKYEAGEKIAKICEDYVYESVSNVIGKPYKLTMSVGIHIIKNPREPINILVDMANIARVKGKSSHKNTYTYFHEEMKMEYDMRNNIVFQMENAIKNNEFYIVYQPKVDLKTLNIAGAEALIRWKTSDGTIIYPSDFIPVFEANGFTVDIDMYVFNAVCHFIYKYKNDFFIPKISVNLSGKTINETNLIDKLVCIIEKYELKTSMIELEVTESALIENSEEFLKKIADIKKLGFYVSMDDFGAGASSLNRLHSIDLDTLKLDKVFIDNNNDNQKGSVIVESIINMSQKLHMEVVSEGIETKEQAKWLKSINCNLAQGYYFDKPLNENEFIEILKKEKKYSI